jgi:hypothetical protein
VGKGAAEAKREETRQGGKEGKAWYITSLNSHPVTVDALAPRLCSIHGLSSMFAASRSVEGKGGSDWLDSAHSLNGLSTLQPLVS